MRPAPMTGSEGWTVLEVSRGTGKMLLVPLLLLFSESARPESPPKYSN